MQSVKLRVDPRSLTAAESCCIIGTIYFDFPTLQFPERNWSDFVVVLLGWWLEATRWPITRAELRFMDGPFVLRIAPVAGDNVVLKGIEDRGHERELCHCVASIKELRLEIESAAKSILEECRARKWVNEDVERLGYLLGNP